MRWHEEMMEDSCFCSETTRHDAVLGRSLAELWSLEITVVIVLDVLCQNVFKLIFKKKKKFFFTKLPKFLVLEMTKIVFSNIYDITVLVFVGNVTFSRLHLTFYII